MNVSSLIRPLPIAGLAIIEGGVVSGVINLESPGVGGLETTS
jgi:hypothetical protein